MSNNFKLNTKQREIFDITDALLPSLEEEGFKTEILDRGFGYALVWMPQA